MEALPKWLAKKFQFFASKSILFLWLMLMGCVFAMAAMLALILPFGDYWALVLVALFMVCLVGLMCSKFYYQRCYLTGELVKHSKGMKIAFLTNVYLFLAMTMALLLLPLLL
ncbi:hypothetical protein [Vibrio intestinalis]|uniref:hypothetical protein n=1 Tax=Vibrio intestinalis TaxID=2933291 RepID=UPI0021A4AC5B|nr:hypothetical protein [Vibrio intestinalis]